MRQLIWGSVTQSNSEVTEPYTRTQLNLNKLETLMMKNATFVSAGGFKANFWQSVVFKNLT